ncbi:uncharacterized protein LOC119349835 [Triticum dicoccoides]|uniref:uncharacterized protein LOC119349835 n=1 Tax=Triticum dicoccoides TaxID=85692 RepID=UPI00188F9E46|nr:uncharacterized protein LOC119349835 [Triticum dicoccoides]
MVVVTLAQAGGEIIDAGTIGSSNRVTTRTQAGEEIIDAGPTGTSNPVAATTLAEAGGEIIDAGTIGSSNRVTTPTQAGQEIIDTGTAGTYSNSSEHVVISMARPPFRAVNQDLFTPLSVSIGPYHRATCSERWKQEKQRVAKATLKSLEHQLRQQLWKLVGDVKALYVGLPNMELDDFVTMLLEDGCYVLTTFVKYHEDPVVIPPRGERNTVVRDIMYLLENQLPMIVLEEIHRCLTPGRSVVEDVEERVLELLKEQLYIRGEKRPLTVPAAPCHLLQLVHRYFQPSISVNSGEQSEPPQLERRSATGSDVQEGTQDRDNTRRRVGRWQQVQAAACQLLQLVRTYFQPSISVNSGEQSEPPQLERRSATGSDVQEGTQDRDNTRRRVGRWQQVQAAACQLLQLVRTYFQPSISVNSGEQSEPPQLERRSATGSDVQEGTQDREDNTRRRVGRWRRATEYSRYGNVQLKPREFKDGVESILDVRLEGSTLWIPHLRIDSSTWTILRNLMALEEQTGTGGSPVTAYCLFMSQLASKVEDIELLKRKEIVDHSWGNDEEVAQGFADLWKKVVLDDVDNVDSNYLRDTWYLLHDRCESVGHNCWGSFRHIYCGESMRFLAFVTAGLLFAFQLIQVILAGFSLRQQQGK